MARKPAKTTPTTKRVLDALEVPEVYREPKHIGRPLTYTQELGDLICHRIAKGETLRALCQEEGMPHRQTIFEWRMKIPAFGDQYARAREASAEALEDEAVEASRLANDKDSAAAARVLADTIKWAAAKRAPKTYGDRTTVDLNAKLTLEQLVQQAILPAPATPAIEGSAVEIATPEESEG